jgi:hypothetical protein
MAHEVAHVAHQLHAGDAVRPGLAPAESALELGAARPGRQGVDGKWQVLQRDRPGPWAIQ